MNQVSYHSLPVLENIHRAMTQDELDNCIQVIKNGKAYAVMNVLGRLGLVEIRDYSKQV